MKITSRVSITSSPLVLKEGIVANNDILTFEEFKIFMKQRLNEEVIGLMLSRFNQIAGYIRAGHYKKAYLMWEEFERDILLNKNYAVSLLFIENINSPEGNYQYRYNSREYDVLSDRGKLTKLSQLNQKLMKESVEEQISEHLSQFIGDVETYTVPWKYIQQIFQIGDSDVKSNAANARWRTHNWTYRNILYGGNPVWQGNVADAFMNHMAHLHVQLIAQDSIDDQNLFATSVFREEKDNIFNLLYASRNNTSWITGGDIIIKYAGQLYNIQLKTGQQSQSKRKRSRIGGKLATQDLLNFIEQIKLDLQTSNTDAIIEQLYNELQTSGWVEQTSHVIENIADNFITTNLTK